MKKEPSSFIGLSDLDRLQLKLKKFYERMHTKEDESEWTLEKIYGIKNKKELDFIKRLDVFKKTDIDINKKLDGLIK